MNQRFMDNMKVAKKEHDERIARLNRNFKKHVQTEADIMGCDKKCFHNAV